MFMIIFTVFCTLDYNDLRFPDSFSITNIKIIRFVPNDSESSIKLLGIHLDSKLTLKDHISHIISKISSAIFSLKIETHGFGLYEIPHRILL